MASRLLSWEDVRLFLAMAEDGGASQASRSLQPGQPSCRHRLGGMKHGVSEALVRPSHRLEGRLRALIQDIPRQGAG